MSSLNDNQLKRMEYLLGGDFKDFPAVDYDKQEKKLDICLESEEPSFLESISKFYDIFENYQLNENDMESLNGLDINEELFQIMESLDAIKEKAINEDMSAVSGLLSIAIPGLALITPAILAAFNKNGEAKLPTKVANTIYDIGQYITKGKEKERRAVIEAALKRNNPNIDSKDLKYFVDKAIEDADKKSAKPTPKNSAKHGTYTTDFAEINRKRFNLT